MNHPNDKIQQAAEACLKDCYGHNVTVTDLPIDARKIAKHLGLDIKEQKFDDPGISGKYNRSHGIISVAHNEHERRQAFTIAHEIGHHLLHKNEVSETLYRMYAIIGHQAPITIEREANSFAAHLLMPEQIVRQLWEQEKQTDPAAAVKKIAKRFEVSADAMRWRLHNLGLGEYSNLLDIKDYKTI